MQFSREDVREALENGIRLRQGKTKFKALLKRKDGLLIVVCDEYPEEIVVITVLQKRG